MKFEKITDINILNTIPLKELRAPVAKLYSAEEKDVYNAITNEEEKRKMAIEMYNKYIDSVIEPSGSQTTENSNPQNPQGDNKLDNLAQTGNVNTSTQVTTMKKNVNVNTAFTVLVRGIQGYNNTLTFNCDKLLLLAIRNPKGSIQFRTKERATQFVRILENVKVIKGIGAFSEEARKDAIKGIKRANGLLENPASAE